MALYVRGDEGILWGIVPRLAQTWMRRDVNGPERDLLNGLPRKRNHGLNITALSASRVRQGPGGLGQEKRILTIPICCW
jgi:hypothetical protein